MYLLIDLSQKDTIHLALFDETNIEHIRVEGRNRELLVSIDAFLKGQNVKKEAIAGIMTVVGSGGFTSTRIAAVVANVFGYVLQIPLLAITKDEAENVQKMIPKLHRQEKGVYVHAQYSGEPNIGK